MLGRGALFLSVILLAACNGGSRREPSARASGDRPPPEIAKPPAPRSSETASSAAPPASVDAGRQVPPEDIRISRALEAPLPEDIVIAFDHVAAGKLPFSNYRYQVTADGKLYYSRHTGTPGDWQTPFDRPLPVAPTRELGPAVVTAMLGRLDAGGFFRHSGYEANLRVEDGSYWLVRARRGKALQTVVFVNTKPDYVAALEEIAVPLRAFQPPKTKRGPIPRVLAERLEEFVSAKLADDIVLAFSDIGRTKSQALNVRWQLAADGRLFLVRHGGESDSVPFDRPLPSTPTAKLSSAEVAALRSTLADGGFFEHPGYEEEPAAGGTLLVIRGRREQGVHTVVLSNVRNRLTERLRAIASEYPRSDP